MRGDLEALQPKSHAKAQRAPREIFGSLLLFLKISLILPYSIKKTKKENFFGILAPWQEEERLVRAAGRNKCSFISYICSNISYNWP